MPLAPAGSTEQQRDSIRGARRAARASRPVPGARYLLTLSPERERGMAEAAAAGRPGVAAAADEPVERRGRRDRPPPTDAEPTEESRDAGLGAAVHTRAVW